MTNRISSYAGIEWLRFLVSQRLTARGEPVLDTIAAMLCEPDWFKIDESQTKRLSDWDAMFGFRNGE
jgi:hypothetical protein